MSLRRPGWLVFGAVAEDIISNIPSDIGDLNLVDVVDVVDLSRTMGLVRRKSLVGRRNWPCHFGLGSWNCRRMLILHLI